MQCTAKAKNEVIELERLENFKVQIGILVLAEVTAVIMFQLSGMELSSTLLWLMLIVNVVMVIWIVYRFQNEKESRDIDISRILGNDAKDALVFGEIGIITYDESYCATWVNDFLSGRKISIVGKKIASWIPEVNELFQGDVDVVIGKDKEHIYEITRKENAQVLYVRDITSFIQLKKKYMQESLVVGLLQLDNYMEIQQYEDEAKMALINTNLRQPVLDWAKKYGMFVRRLRSDRFLVVLDESIYANIVRDRFSILNEIRNAAELIDVSITLSMSYARGTTDYRLLDQMVNDLLELAQSRGGDQVAVKRYGENVKYYGGNSEAKEKRSKVRVRVMAQAIKEAIIEADRVFILGHREMDFDCMGAAIGISRLCSAYDVDSYIVSKSGGIELQLADALKTYENKLADRHVFVSDEEAAKMFKEKDLVIVVDHSAPEQCGAPLTLDKAEKIMIVDHHRRGENFIDNPLLVYIESSASSVCELITEFFPYQSNKVVLSEEEATLMYLGILVDTNRFKMRTGSRTFEAAAYLRKVGVNTISAENMLKEDFNDFEEQTNIMKYAKIYQGNLLIAAVSDGRIFHRTLMSKAADALLNIKGIEASFVIAKTQEHVVGMSSRSKGSVNVQILMERMHGGGHFTAAALSRENGDVKEIEAELKRVIDGYIEEMEEEEHESNSTK